MPGVDDHDDERFHHDDQQPSHRHHDHLDDHHERWADDTTTSLAPTTTTSSTTTSTTTTTTLASLTSCPSGGLVDVITTLVPDINTFSSGQVGGIEVDVGYPASVSMPGSQFLPVNDPSDPATLIVLLSRTPRGINLYDGLVTFFDVDSAAPFVLRTVLTLAQPTPPSDPFGANLIFNQAVPFRACPLHVHAGSGALVDELHMHDPAGGEPSRWHRASGSTPAVRVDAGRALLRRGFINSSCGCYLDTDERGVRKEGSVRRCWIAAADPDS